MDNPVNEKDLKHKKVAFIISIVLLVCSLPFTVLGIIYHREKIGADNKGKEFHYNNKLYFYKAGEDGEKKLLGMYQCSYSNCGYAKENINDSEYGYQQTKVSLAVDKIIDDRFVIISDSPKEQTEIKIYDIVKNKELGKFAEYKIYNFGIVMNYIIVKSFNGLYGVVQIKNGSLVKVLPFEYEFIGLRNKRINNKIVADNFIVFKDNLWSIVDKTGIKKTIDFANPIVNFDGTSVITQTLSGRYSLNKYDGTTKVNGEFKKISYISSGIEVIDIANNYYIMNKDTGKKVSANYEITDSTVIGSRAVGQNKVQVIIDGKTKETVEI